MWLNVSICPVNDDGLYKHKGGFDFFIRFPNKNVNQQIIPYMSINYCLNLQYVSVEAFFFFF